VSPAEDAVAAEALAGAVFPNGAPAVLSAVSPETATALDERRETV
jgi:hypothetical protein